MGNFPSKSLNYSFLVVVSFKECPFKFADNQAEMMIEPSPANENATQRSTNESQASDAPQPQPQQQHHLTLNISIASARENGSEIVEKNVQIPSNKAATDPGKCCASDSHKGNGKRGKDLDSIQANYLKVNVDKIVDRVYRYEVTIQTDGPKNLYTKVFLKFCANIFPKQAKQIAFDADKMIAVSPCMLDIAKGKFIQHKFKFALPHVENDWKQSKKSKNQQLNKTWNCCVRMIGAADKFSISLKRVLAG